MINKYTKRKQILIRKRVREMIGTAYTRLYSKEEREKALHLDRIQQARYEYLMNEVRGNALEISEEILKTLKTAKLTYEEAYGILQFVADTLEYERSFIHIDIVQPSCSLPETIQQKEE